jgi:hypothetical protein
VRRCSPLIFPTLISGLPFPASLFDLLKDRVNFNAGYSFERDGEGAPICEEETWEKALEDTKKWAQDKDGPPVCWLYGPPCSGKSVISRMIAENHDKLENNLAFSYFFSRRDQNRNDMTKFFPTFAYRLATLLPSVQQPMYKVFERDSYSIFNKSPRDQFTDLIVQPVQSAVKPPSPMIIVIDGLDEYDPNQGGFSLERLIQCLVLDSPKPLFRLLFTSRPYPHIEAIFSKISPSRIAIQDFSHGDKVYNYLHQELDQVWIRRELQRGWPTQSDCLCLAKKSDNIRIYVETLVRFIDDDYDDPLRKLRIALKARNGLDSLCKQVLHDAQKYRHFDLVLGAIIFIRGLPEIRVLPPLLGLTSVYDVRLALRGCSSILLIPDDDNDCVRPHHASLLGFLTNLKRGRDRFIDPVRCNGAIVNGCIQLIITDSEADANSLRYACQNWCHHFHMMLFHAKVGDVQWNVSCGVENFLQDMFRWFKHWMMGCGDDRAVEQVRNDLYSACREVRQAMLV